MGEQGCRNGARVTAVSFWPAIAVKSVRSRPSKIPGISLMCVHVTPPHPNIYMNIHTYIDTHYSLRTWFCRTKHVIHYSRAKEKVFSIKTVF